MFLQLLMRLNVRRLPEVAQVAPTLNPLRLYSRRCILTSRRPGVELAT
jgi:hypothetical protein